MAKKAAVNPFEALAHPGAVASSSKKSDKPTASVTTEIKAAVDKFIGNKGAMKKMEAEQAELETAIIGHVRPQQDELAYAGQFTKSMAVPGSSLELTYVTSDRFSSIPDPETAAEVKKIVGDKKFDEFFEVKRTIALKPEVVKEESGDKLRKIAEACEKAGLSIAELFDVGDRIVAKADLDRNQYTLPKEKLPLFRSVVRQSKPALK